MRDQRDGALGSGAAPAGAPAWDVRGARPCSVGGGGACAANENTDRRTLRWGVVEALACVVLSVSQIVYVRRLFKSSGGTLLPRFGV